MTSKENRVLMPLCFNNSSAKLNTDANNLSPVTDLTLNLGGLTTGHTGTPRRKFSWSGGTPVATTFTSQGSTDSPLFQDSPMFQERLLRQVSLDNYSNSSGLRRIQSFPCRALQPSDKENVPTNRMQFPQPAVYTEAEDSICGNIAQDEKASISIFQSAGLSSRKPKTPDLESPCNLEQKDRWNHSNVTDESPKIKCSFITDEDDGFLDVFNMDDDDDDENLLPSGMSDLLTAPLVQERSLEIRPTCHHSSDLRRTSIRRCLSMVSEFEQERLKSLSPNSGSPFSSLCNEHHRMVSSGCDRNNNREELCRKRLCNDDNGTNADNSLKVAFKRPEPPTGEHAFETKRRKSVTFVTRCSSDSQVVLSSTKKLPSHAIQRSHSESEATIKLALQRSVQEPDLIGDFSKTYALPLEQGRHQDLKTISIHTLARLIRGEYEVVDSYTVVDCRYPYEFDGGHIQDSKNVFTKEGVLEEFLTNTTTSQDKSKRHVLVFHCEFSSERGPALCRFLRNMDRDCNKDSYPQLCHPELYVLEGGYKAFYEVYMGFCVPQLYKPMLHKDHENDLRKFRAKSKSWNGDSKSRVAVRPGLKL